MSSQRTSTPALRPLKLFLIAGEHSGDALGAKLIEVLRTQSERPIEFQGIGGELMEEQGCPSLFPLSELAVMSLVDVLPRLPNIWRRIWQSVDAVIAQSPDALVILDSPEFTHQVAKRVRRRAPQIPIIDYVSPSVWAWRPGRARKMRRYVDHILAILPFEPEAHRRLGGPACSYVGHPPVERGEAADGAFRRRLAQAAIGDRTLRGDPARSDKRSPADRRGIERLAGGAAYRERRGRQIRCLQARACGTCRLRHRDARACTRRHANGRRLSGRPDREQLALSADRPLGGAAQSHPRRECLPRASQ